MPPIEDSLRAGDLDETLRQLQEQVRKEPANAKHRIFLFQLLSVMGQWERALNQLSVAGELDAGALAMVQTYREALRCEVLRGQIFAGRHTPLIFGQPDPWMALLLDAQRLLAEGAHAQSNALRLQALETAPASSGRVDGVSFDWIMDADARLGPVLEAIVNGRYYWIPFHRIRSIAIDKPEDLRDLVWMPAHFAWTNGGEAVGLIPTRYPGTESSPDDQLRLARKTDWLEPEPGLYLGQGQRILTTDADDYSLMDVRRIDLESPPDRAADTAEPST